MTKMAKEKMATEKMEMEMMLTEMTGMVEYNAD